MASGIGGVSDVCNASVIPFHLFIITPGDAGSTYLLMAVRHREFRVGQRLRPRSRLARRLFHLRTVDVR